MHASLLKVGDLALPLLLCVIPSIDKETEIVSTEGSYPNSHMPHMRDESWIKSSTTRYCYLPSLPLCSPYFVSKMKFSRSMW